MDYGKSIKFPLDDPSWVTKVIIGIVIGFIPIVNFAQQGYGLEIIRRVARGEEEELPAWDNFGSYIVQGLAVSVAVFIYSLPAMVLMGLFVLVLDSIGALSVLFILLFVVYMVALALLVPAAMTHYALEGYWTAMFDVSWIIGYVSRNLGNYIALLVVTLVFGAVAGLIGSIIIVGAIVVAFWVILMLGHLLGQLARNAA